MSQISLSALSDFINRPQILEGPIQPPTVYLQRAATEPKQKTNPALQAAAGSAVTGAVVGAVPELIKNKGTVKQAILKGGKYAAIGAGLGGASVLIGNKLLGNPQKKEKSAYTKRAALGGAVGGGLLGAAAVAAAFRNKRAMRELKDLAKGPEGYRPAKWILRAGPTGGAAIGAAGGAIVGAYQGADEGMQVDTLQNVRKLNAFYDKITELSAEPAKEVVQLSSRQIGKTHQLEALRKRTTEFMRGKDAYPEFQASGAELKEYKLREQIMNEDGVRSDKNYTKAGVYGALAGLAIPSKKYGRLKRAAIGAGAGIAGVGAVRAASMPFKDEFGDRPYEAKSAEGLPASAAKVAIGAGLLYRSKRVTDAVKNVASKFRP